MSTAVRPAGTAPGVAGFALAAAGGVAIAHLTGATAVLIVLAAGVAAALVCVPGGWLALRAVTGIRVDLPADSVAGQPVPLHLAVAIPRAGHVWADVEYRASRIASGWVGVPFEATFPRRGEVGALDVVLRARGALGLVWWKRTVTVVVGPHLVAPAALHGPVTIDRRNAADDGEHAGRAGAVNGDTDGVRVWRDGDHEASIHWVSSLRSGELVVHERRTPADRTTVVRAAVGSDDPDRAAAAALGAACAALAAGDSVALAAGPGEPVPVTDRIEAGRWAATAPLGDAVEPRSERPSWTQLDVVAWLRRPIEPERTAGVAGRWWAAAATLVALVMLAGSLEFGPAMYALSVVGVVGGAAVSAPTLRDGGEPPGWVRAVAGVGALGAVAVVAASAGSLDGLLAVLRGPLPQLLVVLVVLHGIECRDRRTVRVGLAVSAVIVMYAAGFRVDRTLGVWLAGWALCVAVALIELSRPTGAVPGTGRRLVPGAGWARPGLGLGAVAVLMLALLAVVPVPGGPARLTLPTLIDEHLPVGAPGALAGPDGTVRATGDVGDGDRSRISPSDYAGFAESLDTNVRGELGDTVIMRVRAAQPDFWRGQTFAAFDGRVWHADDSRGIALGGPNIDVPPAFGDPAGAASGRFDLEPEPFTQTFFVEQDLPNLLYHAYQPDELVVDADVWVRPDGALRSTTVLPAGSVYTVVSERRPVTADWLRRVGDVATRLTPLGREAMDRYLDVPASTSPETRALADDIAADVAARLGTSFTTYDLVRAYEAWIDANVAYDLDGPLPAEGTDAVHDLLFGSRRGFCEQIASALVVMLRTQGVPARLATGYAAGRRDPVAGVWEVRASDAHAWTEVWFPEIGWQAFDPTAGVPLAGDADVGTIGLGVLRGLAAHPGLLVLALAGPLAASVLIRLAIEVVRRRRRGRWGLLQDRYTRLAGAAPGATNLDRAARWTATDDAELARLVAERLDAVAFDPEWRDDDAAYALTSSQVRALPRRE